MVLNTDLKEIMMDHALRTISYIADIGDLVVLMARRRFVPHEMEDPPKINRTPKMICHVFESDEVSIYINFSLQSRNRFGCLGSVHCSIDWSGFSSSLYGIFESQRHRRS